MGGKRKGRQGKDFNSRPGENLSGGEVENPNLKFFPGQPVPLGKAVEEFLREAGFFPAVQIHFLLGRFPQFFPDLASFCRPTGFRNHTLYFEVDDPLLVLEVRNRSDRIIARYRKEGLEVERIKIKC